MFVVTHWQEQWKLYWCGNLITRVKSSDLCFTTRHWVGGLRLASQVEEVDCLHLTPGPRLSPSTISPSQQIITSSLPTCCSAILQLPGTTDNTDLDIKLMEETETGLCFSGRFPASWKLYLLIKPSWWEKDDDKIPTWYQSWKVTRLGEAKTVGWRCGGPFEVTELPEWSQTKSQIQMWLRPTIFMAY